MADFIVSDCMCRKIFILWLTLLAGCATAPRRDRISYEPSLYRSCSTTRLSGTLDEKRFEGRRIYSDRIFVTYESETTTSIILEDNATYKEHKTRYYALPHSLYKDIRELHLGRRFYDHVFQLFESGHLLGAQISGGDGCGAYEVVWEIDRSTMKARRLMIHAHEADGFREDRPWTHLQQISPPQITYDR